MFQSFDAPSFGESGAERLPMVRAELERVGVTGFLVPRADAHQGEYVAPGDERLAWLTGFTGSAGIAVVLLDRAALFADGRYTLQASKQIDTDAFEIVPVHKTAPSDWLPSVVGADDRIGYDPWLHGKAEIDKLRAALAKTGAELVSLDQNPLDTVWTDQPPKPAGAVRIHDAAIAGIDGSTKRREIGAAIADKGAAAAVISLPDSLSWLLNIRGGDIVRSPIVQGFALVQADGQVQVYMDTDKVDGDVRAHLGNEVSVLSPSEMTTGITAADGPVLLDERTCPLWFVEQLEKAGTKIVWGRDPCILPKATKNGAELDGTRVAHVRDGAAMVRFLHWFDTTLAAGETLTEIDVAKRLEAFRAETGVLEDISFDTIAGSGPNGAIVHYRVNSQTNRTLVPGDLMLVDSGGQYADGTTDITRTMATGPVSQAQRQHFTLVLKGMIAISTIRWPEGVRGRDIDVLARAALWRAGFDYDHGTGHGVGVFLNVHEGPQNLSRRGDQVLLPGMILSNEPGYYEEGAYGIRIENLVIVAEPSVPEGGNRPMLGFETLTWCPIDRRLIDAALLTVEERDWLNAYHAEVETRLSSLVRENVRDWLSQACAPI